MTITQKFTEIVAHQGYNFKEWFGGMEYKKDTDEVYSVVLPKPMDNREIFDTYNPQEVSLGQMYECIDKKSHATYIISYVRDKNSVLREVRVYWDRDGWVVDAYPVEYRGTWGAGNQVFSSIPFTTPDTLPLDEMIQNVKDAGYKVYKEV